MRYSRTGVIAVLIAAELFVASVIVVSAGGLKTFTGMGDAQGFSNMSYTLRAIDAGDRPHVVIDDADSGVTVSASNDGKVHVTDTRHIHGWGSAPARVQLQKTVDGVLIERPAKSGDNLMFGFEFGGTVVEIPPGSTLEIRNASGADVSDLTGTIAVRSDDGHISATNVHTGDLTLSTADGHISLTDVDAGKLSAVTSDGAIRVSNLRVRNGVLHTSDGSIHIGFADAGDVTVRAQTGDGSIRINGIRQDGSPVQYKFGNGSGTLDVATQDGSIRVNTNGAN
ncbi:MAG TPA: DUF4097 family beta strand repeat-containing protein [Candidatus Rubrimentiphilum sp.]|nr:DUF4097 family beta strand repeat-containing protein [Candidatus Rubrimentiphilum sp.]